MSENSTSSSTHADREAGEAPADQTTAFTPPQDDQAQVGQTQADQAQADPSQTGQRQTDAPHAGQTTTGYAAGTDQAHTYQLPPEDTRSQVHKFRRSCDDRMIAGVCGGAANFLGVDAVIIRLALIAAILLGFGTGLLVYLACWVIVPQE
jgi:phage shock protein PspC (stress-responsive transcriptional regulator)